MKIPLYKGRVLVGWTLVSPEDYDLISWLWRDNGGGYAVRYDDAGRAVLMHRQIMGLTRGDGLEVDHINGDPRDNRRENLRLATRSEQGQNTRKRSGTKSQYRGVTENVKPGRWKAQAKRGGRTIYLGTFDTEEEASAAYEAYRAENYTHARRH